ncbi:MAG: DUF21 domain-containing protein [Sedimentisphaerales bacterium]|nr:DUF21 domain-containing protein [Sedimentisphaerales bacterium]
MTLTDILLLLLFFVFVLLAGLFAGAETGVYQLSRLRLRLGVEHKKFSYVLLSSALHDGAGLLISLLLGTNLCHYLATSCMTYLVLANKGTEGGVAFIATLIATPIFFVFSELIPKNLFYYRADQITPAVSPVIYLFDRLTRITGLTWLLKGLSKISSGLRLSQTAIKRTSAITTRIGLETILRQTSEEGILTTTQAEMMRRLSHISYLSISSCMIGLPQSRLVNVKSSKADLLKICEQYPYTRYPVYDGWDNNIIGYINIYECLSPGIEFFGLYDFLKPIHKLPADTSVMDAIDYMQEKGDRIVLVTTTDQKEKPVGILTMKDLAEELLGELAEW